MTKKKTTKKNITKKKVAKKKTTKGRKAKKESPTIAIVLGLIILAFFSIGVLATCYVAEEKIELAKHNIQTKSIQELYDFYIAGKPSIQGRSYIGSENASITIVAYMDPYADSSKLFMTEVYPEIKEEFIDTNIARVYFKNPLSKKDITDQTEMFFKSQAIYCVQQEYTRVYEDFIVDMFSISSNQELDHVLYTNAIPESYFLDCMNSQTFEFITEDASEVSQFRIADVKQRLYIGIEDTSFTRFDGIPSVTQLRKLIYNKQIQKGDEIDYNI